MPPQEVRIGTRLVRQIAFLTPVSTGRKVDKGERMACCLQCSSSESSLAKPTNL